MASDLKTFLGLLVLFLSSGECLAQFDRPWKVYAVPFSHTDVGYTATVPDVIRAHELYLDSVVAYVNRTATNAEGSRFKWTIEIPWVLEYYIRDRSAAQVESLMTLVRNGSVEIGAIHFNLQTDLCGNEELARSLSYAQELRQTYAVPIRAAMIDDTPGFTWSLAQLLPKSDVPYLSVAMNSFLCDFYKTTTVPFLFYHQAQSGDRVLVWRCIDSLWAYLEGGISLGVYGTYANFDSRLAALLNRLAQRGYPYNEIFINCATGDNESPNLTIVNNVQQWNSIHSDANVVIATVSQFFDTVSAKYAGQIPVLSGDAPNWWAWLFSTSASGVFAQSRRAQVQLPAAEILSSAAFLWDPGFVYPEESFRGAYVNNLLVEDHNLGAASGSADGNAEFWARKVGWVSAAHDSGASLIAGAVRSLRSRVKTGAHPAIVVFNPTAWERSGIVPVSLSDPAISSLSAFDIIDPKAGTALLLQRLSDSTIAFMGTGIPAIGYRSFPVVGRSGTLPQRASLAGLTLENEFYRVQMDQTTGSVKSILDKAIGGEIVSTDGVFNQYRFNGIGTPGALTVAASDSGPLLQRITLSGTAPGSSSYQTTVTLVSGEKRIDFHTGFTRLSPTMSGGEDIDFDFDVAATSPALRYEIPFGNLPIFTNELSGFRSNHYAPQHWIYISLDGASKGLLLATAESPIIAASTGSFTGSLRLLTQYNSPNTAYRAGVGPQQMSFSVTSGTSGFKPDEAASFSYGAIAALPAVIVPPGQSGALPDTAYSLLSITPARLQLSTVKKATSGQGIIVRLFNPTDEPITAQLCFGAKLLGATETSLLEVDRTPLGGGWNSLSVSFAPYEVKTIRAVLSPVLEVPAAEPVGRQYVLSQNFPNPFNPETDIRYQIAENRLVRLVIYDILGREVTILVNERKAPGSYSVRFDARGMASGVYFCRMECTTRDGATFRLSRSMLLLK